MNKFLIVVLAVCLVSVHAFVKREAETPKDNFNFDDALQSIQKSAKDIGAKITDAFNSENVKKQFADFVDGANKAFKDFSSATGSNKEENKQ